MNSLFDKLTSRKPVVRKYSNDSSSSSSCKPIWIFIRDRRGTEGEVRGLEVLERKRLWEQLMMSHNQEWLRSFFANTPLGSTYFSRIGRYSIRYAFREWNPTKVKSEEEPSPSSIVGGKLGLVRSPGRNTGFKDIRGLSSRIKAFRLSDALTYSYMKDNRFILALCVMLGFSLWCLIAPEPLLLKPEALTSPDINFLYKVSKDTFINKVCSTHPLIKSPCDCGEPLNNELRKILDTNSFDPLGIEETKRYKKSFAVYIAAILITIALAESVSTHGIYYNINE